MARSRAGFTLLELLVSLALLGLIAGALASSTRLGGQVWKRSQELPNLDAQILIFREFRRWLLVAKSGDLAQGHAQRFEGTDEGFSFLTNARHPELQPGEDLLVQLDNQSRIRLAAFTVGVDSREIDQRRLLLAESPLTFRYYDPEEKSWVTQWDLDRGWPSIVEMKVEGHSFHFSLGQHRKPL